MNTLRVGYYFTDGYLRWGACSECGCLLDPLERKLFSTIDARIACDVHRESLKDRDGEKAWRDFADG